jgi:hypothetical protein
VAIVLERLEKGTTLEPEFLEALFEVPRTDGTYRLKMLSLIEEIQDESNKAGRPLLCRDDDFGIRIMDDSEALKYKKRAHDLTVRRLYRTNTHLSRIDESKLDDLEKKAHEREIIRQSRVIQAVKSERRRPMPTPYKKSGSR